MVFGLTHRLAILVGVAALTVACGSSVNTTEGGRGGSGGGGDGGSGAATTGPDLYSCGIPAECEVNHGHLGMPIPPEVLRCGGELVASGEVRALRETSTPGPYATIVETLVVLLGDGRAYRQTRTRCAMEDACADQNTTEWALLPLQLCNVLVDPADIAGCGDPNGTCEYSGYVDSCADVPDDWSCNELP